MFDFCVDGLWECLYGMIELYVTVHPTSTASGWLPLSDIVMQTTNRLSTNYCTASNFRQEKIFADFTNGHH